MPDRGGKTIRNFPYYDAKAFYFIVTSRNRYSPVIVRISG